VARLVLLDTGPLGKLAHPKAHPELAAWFARLMDADISVVVPEIADYELRRNFLLEGLDISVRRLDQLEQQAGFLPITTSSVSIQGHAWDARTSTPTSVLFNGAGGGTRTRMDFSTRPSNVRVCQFHHSGGEGGTDKKF
jgi:hypothetical protein